MAEIEIERRPPRRTGIWIAVLLGIAVAAVAAWYYLLGPGAAREAGSEGGDTLEVFTPMPSGPPTPLPGDPGQMRDTVGGSVPDTGGGLP